MHVGFLYTLQDKVLSGSGVTKVSKNGIEPSGHVSSSVVYVVNMFKEVLFVF